MKKETRLCDECGTDDEDCCQKCVVCGADLCSDCGASLNTLGEKETRLCKAHYAQVKAYIEELKPKLKVERRHGGYWLPSGIYTAIGGSPLSEGLISDTAADALYYYMKKERKGQS